MNADLQVDEDTIRYARGTLTFRKQRNRKRTPSGEFVWSEEADLIFVLGLIEWARHGMTVVGNRRSFFMERYLRERGIVKTRKQIASRLQVLRGEWSDTQYLHLLKNPEDSSESRRGSTTPPLRDEKTALERRPSPLDNPPFQDPSPPRHWNCPSTRIPSLSPPFPLVLPDLSDVARRESLNPYHYPNPGSTLPPPIPIRSTFTSTSSDGGTSVYACGTQLTSHTGPVRLKTPPSLSRMDFIYPGDASPQPSPSFPPVTQPDQWYPSTRDIKQYVDEPPATCVYNYSPANSGSHVVQNRLAAHDLSIG